jgi:hypothetical protein
MDAMVKPWHDDKVGWLPGIGARALAQIDPSRLGGSALAPQGEGRSCSPAWSASHIIQVIMATHVPVLMAYPDARCSGSPRRARPD